MAILGFELEEIVRLIRMLEESGLDEMVIREETRYLRVRGPGYAPSHRSMTMPSAAPVSTPVRRLPPVTAAPAAAGKQEESGINLVSPMMGMFYRAEKPGGPPLVTVGQHVSIGQIIGIIEAMKIFSEVLAEHAGVVIAVPAQDGQLVHAGAPLIVLRSV